MFEVLHTTAGLIIPPYGGGALMRRIMLLSAVAAVMAAMVIAPGVAGAQENASQQCKDRMDIGSSHGGCVALLEAAANSTTANRATGCQDPEFRKFIESIYSGEIKNHGQCMQALENLFG